MQHYLIIGASSGIGQELAKQLSDEGKQVIGTYHKNEPANEIPSIQFHHLNVLEDELNLDFLPEELAGFVYCPGSINLKPFERIKPADFELDFKLQVSGAIKILQLVLPRLKKISQCFHCSIFHCGCTTWFTVSLASIHFQRCHRRTYQSTRGRICSYHSSKLHCTFVNRYSPRSIFIKHRAQKRSECNSSST
jgi:NAD(P)-dependent dehydrogenase (short-subunit alcohol dehydrogenase family)